VKKSKYLQYQIHQDKKKKDNNDNNIQVDELTSLKKQLHDKDLVMQEQIRRIEDLEMRLKKTDQLMITL